MLRWNISMFTSQSLVCTTAEHSMLAICHKNKTLYANNWPCLHPSCLHKASKIRSVHLLWQKNNPVFIYSANFQMTVFTVEFCISIFPFINHNCEYWSFLLIHSIHHLIIFLHFFLHLSLNCYHWTFYFHISMLVFSVFNLSTFYFSFFRMEYFDNKLCIN